MASSELLDFLTQLNADYKNLTELYGGDDDEIYEKLKDIKTQTGQHAGCITNLNRKYKDKYDVDSTGDICLQLKEILSSIKIIKLMLVADGDDNEDSESSDMSNDSSQNIENDIFNDEIIQKNETYDFILDDGKKYTVTSM